MTDNMYAGRRVRQLRLVVEADDFAEAVAFYRDVLGLPEQAAIATGDDARVVILDAGQATLEIANPAQKRMIDEVEVGRQVAPRIRVAFEVDDAAARTAEAVRAGATEVAPPTRTPWSSLNSRLEAPAGLQITLFQELVPNGDQETQPGPGTGAGR
jgi:predicted enzyme related to lactoylglutathione lyase